MPLKNIGRVLVTYPKLNVDTANWNKLFSGSIEMVAKLNLDDLEDILLVLSNSTPDIEDELKVIEVIDKGVRGFFDKALDFIKSPSIKRNEKYENRERQICFSIEALSNVNSNQTANALVRVYDKKDSSEAIREASVITLLKIADRGNDIAKNFLYRIGEEKVNAYIDSYQS